MVFHKISNSVQLPTGLLMPQDNSRVRFSLHIDIDANCPTPPDNEIREAAEKLIHVIHTAWNEGCFEVFKSSRQEHFKSADRFDELLKAAGSSLCNDRPQREAIMPLPESINGVMGVRRDG